MGMSDDYKIAIQNGSNMIRIGTSLFLGREIIDMHENKNIGFIGGGMVAEAIIRGLILHGHDASKIFVSDPSEDRRNILSILNKKLNVHENNQEVSDQSDVLIICVKPQVFKEENAQSFTTESNEKMIISVAAGIEIDSMASLFGEILKSLQGYAQYALPGWKRNLGADSV